jgi:hypothetical protein
MTKTKNEKTPPVTSDEGKSNKQLSNSSEKNQPSKRLKTSKAMNESSDPFIMPKTGREIVFETSVSKNDIIHKKDIPPLTNTQQEASLDNLDTATAITSLPGDVNKNIFLNNENQNKTQEFTSQGKYTISFCLLVPILSKVILSLRFSTVR